MSCCLSPIEYFIEYVDYQLSTDPGLTAYNVFKAGYVFPNTINMCCPDYCSDEYILIGQGTVDLQNYRDNGPGFNFNRCCVNVYSLFDNFINLSNDFLDDLPPNESSLYQDYKACCNNNSARCINELLEHTDSTYLKEWFYSYDGAGPATFGLFEYNVINGKFGFCELVDILKTKTPTVAEEYMIQVLEQGIVVACKPNGTFVGSLETYMSTYYP